MNRLGDLALSLWFLLVIAAFWGPYFGFSLPDKLGTAMYAVILLAAIATLALRFLGGRKASADPAPPKNGKVGAP